MRFDQRFARLKTQHPEQLIREQCQWLLHRFD
jgi:hypothetical protein